MKKIKYNHTSYLFLFISTLSLIGFGLLAWAIQSLDLIPLQTRIYHFIDRFRSPFLTSLMISFTKTANPLPIAIITLLTTLFFILKKNYSIAFLSFMSIVSLTLSNVLLKNLFMRPRPSYEWLINETGYSFPSGHAMMSFGMAMLLCFLLHDGCQSRLITVTISILGFLYATFIAFSRVYVNVHFLSDVMGGFLAATVIMCLLFSIYRAFYPSHHQER